MDPIGKIIHASWVITTLLGIAAAALGPLVYHVVYLVDRAEHTGSAIALLLVGLFLPPLGWVHGLCAALGWGWV